MTTTTNNISSNSFGLISPKTSTPQTTCNICKRLLYAFEEVLLCRVCHGSYHWRCVKPETISHYRVNEKYVCDRCNDGTITNSPNRLTNGGIKIKSTDSIDTDYRDFTNIPSKTNSTETNVVNTIRYFEEKQQQTQPNRITKLSELDSYLPTQTNGIEYHHRDSQYNDDSQTARRIQQQQHQNGIESDEENDSSAMFQANYQYTPLKEYAAMRNGRTLDDNNMNGYQHSPPDNSDRQTTSRYGGGLHYSNHGYDPTVSRLVEAPSSGSTQFTSPTADSLSIHNRQHHFTSTSNLNLNGHPSHRQQQTSLVNSTPYLSQIHDDEPPVLKSSFHQQQQTDRHSTVGSDSGIVIVNSNSQQQQHQSDDKNLVEKKLSDLVQQFRKQLENDAQKMNEKLESKLKNLENMIHQQTFIIRRQDEVIERLKNKILKIETERDHFRERLSEHEQRDYDEKKTSTKETDRVSEQDNQSNRKYSNASTTNTEQNKPSTKKTPAPRLDHQWSTTNNENKPPSVARLVKNIQSNRERLASDSSSAPSITGKIVPSVPLNETPAASSRLDNMIHQSTSKDHVNASTSNYSLAQVRHQDRPQNLEPVSMEQQQIVSSVHHDDDNNHGLKTKRSSSLSSSSSKTSSNSGAEPIKTFTPASTANKNLNVHRSFESLQQPYENERVLRPANKTASLEFGTKPVPYDDPGSIYVTPVEGSHPAIQANSIVKGWLRKQNRDSFLKRIERYYCILKDDALLMHRNDHDRTPQKAINLKGAKIFYYDDAKYGPSLELTWSSQTSDPKHYHLYAPNPQEAEKWVAAIQATIRNLESRRPPTKMYKW